MNRSKVGSADQTLDHKIKNQVNRSKATYKFGSTDKLYKKLGQHIKQIKRSKVRSIEQNINKEIKS